MLSPTNSILIFTILLLASLFGIYGERKGWFKKISGVLVTIIIMALLATFGVVPSASDLDIDVPAYDFVFQYFVPLAISLLLFKVQVGRIIRESGRLLLIFLIGSVGVVLGALVAWMLVDISRVKCQYSRTRGICSHGRCFRNAKRCDTRHSGRNHGLCHRHISGSNYRPHIGSVKFG